MEMNTRLQVEHPVTEFVTGLDLVEWQLRVAAGHKLTLTQEQLAIRGHAIEVRLYAEDPDRDFLPASGRLEHLRFPPAGTHVRVDSGVAEGDGISVHYDPMIAKLIVWDEDRSRAVARLGAALAATEVAGLTSNLAFLAALVRHPAFLAGDIDTGFIPRHHAQLLPEAAPLPEKILALASLGLLLEQAEIARRQTLKSNDPYSPWARCDGWRLNGDARGTLIFRDGDRERPVHFIYRSSGYEVTQASGPLMVAGCFEDRRISADLGGLRLTAGFARSGNTITLFVDGRPWSLSLVDPLPAEDAEMPAASRLRCRARLPLCWWRPAPRL